MARYSPFPPYDLEDALVIAKTIWQHNAGKPMRRLTLFDVLGRSPSSSTSRSLVTASSGYGLTEGSYKADILKLTERGQAIAERNDPQSKLHAVLGVDIFTAFFENYKNSVVPSIPAAIDFLKAQGTPAKSAEACFEVLMRSGEQVALIQEISGVKRVVTHEHALEKLTQSLGQIGMQPTPTAPTPSQEPAGPELSLPSFQSQVREQMPKVHVDLHIHISGDARLEQIDQIFASMAKHLYNKGSK